MKKFFYLAILLLTFFPSLVEAKIYNKDSIEKGSYIIGKYLFNKNKTANYDGTLTTPMIMLSSKSIDSNNLDDMIIYYKNSRGKWVNAITGKEQNNVPNNFEITCINLDCVSNFEVRNGGYNIYNREEVLNGVYIIGKYLFNKEKNNIYNGTLTTPMIMLSSKSIDSNNLNDMIIYYKNSRGKWVNAITGQAVSNVPNNFYISNINLIEIENPQIINKKDSTLTLGSTSGTLTYGSSKTIIITKEGDGNLSCTSSNPNVATCDINESTLIVTPQAITEDSSSTITVNLGEGTNYKENSTTYIVTVNRKELTCPDSPEDKTFNNQEQQSGITCPNGSIAGGTKEATNAGTYNQTCTEDNGYKFVNTCSVSWKINKKDSTLTLGSTSGTLTYGSSKTIIITKEGDGNLSCTSSNPNVATCDINESTLIVTPQAITEDSETSTITVNLGEGTNYKENSTTYTVTVNRKDYIASSNRDIDPSKWVATDKLGRTIAIYGDSDQYKGSVNNIGTYGTKKVGIFYWDWHLELQDNNSIDYPEAARKLNKYPYNLSELIAMYPNASNNYNHEIWSINDSKYYWWNEPIYGYYTEADDYVIRKHAELLADAGIDFIVLDCTNGRFLWEKAYENIFKVFQMAKDDGINVPKIVFMLNFNGNSDDYAYEINTLYNKIYKNNLYKDLWFMMDGDNKPLILGGKPTNKNINSAVYSKFTFRTSVAEYTYSGPQQFTNEIKWGWLSTSNQAYYLDLDGNIEQSTVGVAQNYSSSLNKLSAMNGPNIMGRSYAPGYTYSYKYRNKNITIGDHPQGTLYGRNFEHQWEYVRQIDPNYVFVTGWNEWIAGREETWQNVSNAFPDQFNDEYSRDIEPSKGSLKDNYYYQLVSNVRKYKGANMQEKQSTSKTIDIYGNPEQWTDNNLISYNSYINKTAPTRNSKEWGYDNNNYLTNYTFRNDIRTAKVSYDTNNLYFYVETEDKIIDYKNTFRLLLDTIDSTNNSSTNNWNEFEYVINRTGATDDTFALEKSLGNSNWEIVGRVNYKVVSNTIQIEVPLSLLNLNASNLNFNFKWADNNMGDMTNVDDIMSVYTDGDTAPGGRFAFKFYNK